MICLVTCVLMSKTLSNGCNHLSLSYTYNLLVHGITDHINDVCVLLQASKSTIDEELRLTESLQDDLKRVRES